MKLAAFSIALLGGTEALKCSASRGPRPDDVADFVPTTPSFIEARQATAGLKHFLHYRNN